MEAAQNPSDSTCGIMTGRKVRDIVRQYDSAIATESKKHSFQSLSAKASKPENSRKSLNIHSIESNVDNKNADGEYSSSDQLSYGIRAKKGRFDKPEKDHIKSPLEDSTGSLEAKRSFIMLAKSTEDENKLNARNPIPTSYQSKTTIAKTPSGVRIITDIYFDCNSRPADDIIGSHVETFIPPSKILAEFQQKSSFYGN